MKNALAASMGLCSAAIYRLKSEIQAINERAPLGDDDRRRVARRSDAINAVRECWWVLDSLYGEEVER